VKSSKLSLAISVGIITVVCLLISVVSFAYVEQDGEKYVIFGARQPAPNIDPSVHYDWSTRMIQESLYDALLSYEGDPTLYLFGETPQPKSPLLVPCLAESWDISDDGMTYTFRLVKNAVFHNGDPVTAEAVKFSFVRTLEGKQGPAWMLLAILDTETGIEVIDDYTVAFHLNYPFAPFPHYIAWWYIMNPNQVNAHDADWLQDHEAGSGPFKIKEWRHGEYYWLEDVEDYWRGWPHENHIDGFIFKLVREAASQKIGIQKGDLDIVEGLTIEDFGLVAGLPGIYVTEDIGRTTFGIKMNTQKGYTAIKNVRKAICYAFDYDAVIDIYDGHAVLEDSPFPQGLDGYVSLADITYRQDFDKAREYMKKAGFPDGGFTLDYVQVAGHPEETKIGLILKDCLSKIGIGVDIVPLPWPEMCAIGATAETGADMVATYTTPIVNDPDVVASQYGPTAYGMYYGTHFYDNPLVTLWIDQARVLSDSDQRAELYEKIQRQVLEDAPEVFGMLYSRVWAFRDFVKGFTFSPVRFTGEIDMYWLYIEE